MQKVRFGLIGVGMIGARYIDLFKTNQIPGAELTAICVSSPQRVQPAREQFKDIASYFGDFREMMDSGLIDAVLVASPHKFHPEQSIEAFNRGLHVLVEKPAGVEPKSVLAMNQAAERSGKVFGIMFNQRTMPGFAKIREMIKSGELGSLKRAVWIINHWYRSNAYYNSSAWRASWDGEGGGVLINQCSHSLDMWQWLFGVPDKIRAFCGYGKYHPIETEDDVTAYMEYANGMTGSFITSTGEAPGTDRLEISCDMGKLVCEYGDKITFYRLDRPEPELREIDKKPYDKPQDFTVEDLTPSGKAAGHAGILTNFTNAVLHGEPLLAPGAEGLNSLLMSNAMIQSDWLDSTVALPDGVMAFGDLLADKIAKKG